MENVERENCNAMENAGFPENGASGGYAEEGNQAMANGIMPLSAVTNVVTLAQNIVGGKNVLTQSMINQANTRYIIKYDYDLNGATLTCKSGCVLDFQAGSLKNGTLVGNNTYIESPLVQIFYTTLTLSGTYLSFDGYGRVEWYGCYPSQTSVDFKDAYNAISRVFKAVKLQAGQYVTNKGQIQMGMKLEGVHSIGEYGKKSEILIHLPSGVTASYGLCIGKEDGKVNSSINLDERVYGCTLKDVNITTTSSSRIRGYKGLLIGAVGRCTITNIVVWQFTAQTILTDSELSTQVINLEDHRIENISYANMCIAFKGDSEQVVIDGCHTYGDIGFGFMDKTDFVSIRNGLIAQSENGVASIYVKYSAMNLYINNTSLDLGLYGIYFEDAPADDMYNSMFNFNMSNCRIEQLSKALKDSKGYVVGASVYIGKLKGIGPMVFNNVMYGGTNNGVIIRNSSYGGNITFNNCSMFEDSGIKKYIHQFGSPNKNGIFPRVNLNYHHNSKRSAEETIRILDDRIKLSAPIEQIKMGNQSINHFDHIVAYPYEYTSTSVVKEPLQGLRILDDLVSLSPKIPPTGSYFFLPEFNTTNVNKDTFVGIVAEFSYINGSTLEHAKVLFGKNGVTTLESTSGIVVNTSGTSSNNKLYIVYSFTSSSKYAFLTQTFTDKINVRIKMECIYSDSNQY